MDVLSHIVREADDQQAPDDDVVRKAVRVARHGEQPYVRELMTATLNVLRTLSDIRLFFQGVLLGIKMDRSSLVEAVADGAIHMDHIYLSSLLGNLPFEVQQELEQALIAHDFATDDL